MRSSSGPVRSCAKPQLQRVKDYFSAVGPNISSAVPAWPPQWHFRPDSGRYVHRTRKRSRRQRCVSTRRCLLSASVFSYDERFVRCPSRKVQFCCAVGRGRTATRVGPSGSDSGLTVHQTRKRSRRANTASSRRIFVSVSVFSSDERIVRCPAGSARTQWPCRHSAADAGPNSTEVILHTLELRLGTRPHGTR